MIKQQAIQKYIQELHKKKDKQINELKRQIAECNRILKERTRTLITKANMAILEKYIDSATVKTNENIAKVQEEYEEFEEAIKSYAKELETEFQEKQIESHLQALRADAKDSFENSLKNIYEIYERSLARVKKELGIA